MVGEQETTACGALCVIGKSGGSDNYRAESKSNTCLIIYNLTSLIGRFVSASASSKV